MVLNRCMLLIVFLTLLGFIGCYDDNQLEKVGSSGEEILFQIPSVENLEKKYGKMRPFAFSPWVKGVKKKIKTSEKIVALTLDACGGYGGNGYDKSLIAFIEKEKIPATLFLSGKWIKKHWADTTLLAENPLFSIANHGFNHKPASVIAGRRYNIRGTTSVRDLYYEVFENADLIRSITGELPHYYRPGTASIDTVAVRIVQDMGFETIGFSICPGDADPRLSLRILKRNFLVSLKPGAVILLHMNKPKGKTLRLLRLVVPRLREKGSRKDLMVRSLILCRSMRISPWSKS